MTVDSQAVRASTDHYQLGGAVPINDLSTVPSGSCVLVCGPSRLGIDQLALDLLETGCEAGEHGIVITPDQPANRILSGLDYSNNGDGTGTVQVVDCSTADPSDQTEETVRSVRSPANLTEIGVTLTRATQSIGEDASGGVRIALLSLSTWLRYADLDHLFKFLHVATSRFAAARYLCIATMDSETVDGQTRREIISQFDGSLEVRESNGDRELRISGFSDTPTPWTPMGA